MSETVYFETPTGKRHIRRPNDASSICGMSMSPRDTVLSGRPANNLCKHCVRVEATAVS